MTEEEKKIKQRHDEIPDEDPGDDAVPIDENELEDEPEDEEPPG